MGRPAPTAPLAARLAHLRDLLAYQGRPTNRFAVTLWHAELPFEEESRILDELRAQGWRLAVQAPMLDGAPAFVRVGRAA